MAQRLDDAPGTQGRGTGEDDDEENRRDGGQQDSELPGKEHRDDDRQRNDEGHEGRQPAVELVRCHDGASILARRPSGSRAGGNGQETASDLQRTMVESACRPPDGFDTGRSFVAARLNQLRDWRSTGFGVGPHMRSGASIPRRWRPWASTSRVAAASARREERTSPSERSTGQAS